MKKKALAIVLSVIMTFSFASWSSAASDETGEAYPAVAGLIDNAFGAAHDALFGFLMAITRQRGIPDYDDYMAQSDGLSVGTDGRVSGSGWSAGFASGSVIPTSWRCDANGNSDPNGYCLDKLHATGGYQTNVSKLYTDQMLNMVILSNGSDSNANGVDDMLIFISIDGVGITAGTCSEIRTAIKNSLSGNGVAPEDFLAINVSATHCHAALDTQGMSILTLFANKLNPFIEYDRSLDLDMEESICAQAAACAKTAYNKIENGALYFFETDEVNGAHDKLNSGVKTKNTFSCFLFRGISGEQTLLTNIGAHPTSYGAWEQNRMMCADYPYFMSVALKDAGYNTVFTQSAQAAVASPSIDREEGDSNDVAASNYVSTKALSKDDWVQRYGQDYADKQYDGLEKSLENHMKNAYLLAQYIIGFVQNSAEVAPTLNVNTSRTLLNLDYGVMAWGSTSGLLGENVVKTKDSETGYGVVVDTYYMEIGDDVAILTAPGELSPALLLGSDEEYTGSSKWTGATSWTGEDWQYDTLENLVRQKSGDADKTVLLYGITNDALGYMFPDINVPNSLLGTAIFYKEDSGTMTNCMLMTVGTQCGSQLMESYEKTLSEVY